MERRIEQHIPAQATSDGAGVRLRRSLGSAKGTQPDPFLMLDEFDSDRPDDYLAGFPSHPHRGFETVTIMLEGRMLHEDHMGNRGDLGPGDVQWMTAGSGIIHSEMPRQIEGRMRGFQLWINLPSAEKMKPPAYRDIGAAEIPRVDLGQGVTGRLIAGAIDTADGPREGAVKGVTVEPLLMDLELPSTSALSLPVSETATVVVYVYEGTIRLDEQELEAGQALKLGRGSLLKLSALASSRLLVLAAEPLGEPVVQYGPFVMSSRSEIEQALKDYRTGRLAWTPDGQQSQ